MKNILKLFLISIFIAFLFKCAAIQELTKVQNPKVEITNIRFADISFEALDLALDVNVENPNPLSITLAGFNYDLMINNSSFLKGNNENTSRIESMGQSNLQIPLSLNFSDLYNTFQSLKNQDSTSYEVQCGFSFDLPIVGRVTLPVKKSGNLPLLKIPSIKISDLKLQKLGFTGADLILEIQARNPNGFNLFINNFNYDFKINNQSWLKGLSTEQVDVSKKDVSTIKLPISLNFSEIGRSIYQVLMKGEQLNYDFQGAFNFKTSNPLIKQFNLPIDTNGKLDLSK